jgi:hypothetical protein
VAVVSRLTLTILFWLTPAYAEPPPNADPSLSPWFTSLRAPSTGVSCCSISDCRTVITHEKDGKLWAFIGSAFVNAPNAWVEIPESVMIRGRENPTGEPVVCYYGGHVACFINASGT